MNWKLVAHALWHGLSAVIITGATTIATYQKQPEGWGWAIFISGLLVAFVKGVEGYFREPQVGG